MYVDYKIYGLTEEQAKAVQALSPEQLEYAYRLKRYDYLTQDAEDHAEALLADDPELLGRLEDKDYHELAELFDDSHDCNESDNAQWDSTIWDYVRSKP